ncbi:hypothetical protein, partial [Halothiobacillus sp.]|uniref:hypothetical protein n=1 Tax=Halothiobacillus sp. TaxID=1891311 RepID=UPI00260231FA
VAGRLDARRARAAMAAPLQASATPQMIGQRLARWECSECAMTALPCLTRVWPLPAHGALS